jgi:hypothetical protein
MPKTASSEEAFMTPWGAGESMIVGLGGGGESSAGLIIHSKLHSKKPLFKVLANYIAMVSLTL